VLICNANSPGKSEKMKGSKARQRLFACPTFCAEDQTGEKGGYLERRGNRQSSRRTSGDDICVANKSEIGLMKKQKPRNREKRKSSAGRKGRLGLTN